MTKLHNSFKIFYNILFSIIFLFFISISSSAQKSIDNSVSNKKYVRVDIGHGALHCPFLSPKLEAKLREIKNIEDFFIDRQNSFVTFILPADTEMTIESLKKIGTGVGYPNDDVVVLMDDKPLIIKKSPK